MLIPLIKLFEDSARLSGLLAQNQLLSPDRAQMILSIFNDMVDAMSIDGMVMWRNPNQQFNLVPGKYVYTIGPAADWVTPRPAAIMGGYTVINGVTKPLTVISQSEYNLIAYKTIDDDWVDKLLYTNSEITGTVTIWPVPRRAIPIVLSIGRIIEGSYTVDDMIEWPPGYALMLRYNLAVHICNEIGVEPPVRTQQMATSTRASVKRSNRETVRAQFDPMLSRGDSATWWMGN